MDTDYQVSGAKSFWFGRQAGKVAITALCLLVVSCADRRTGGPYGNVPPVTHLAGTASGTSLPSQPGNHARSTPHRIQPLDTLVITVFNEPDLSLKVTVSPEGSINYPLLRSVDLAGLSILEAQQKLTELLSRDYLRSPSVTVAVERSAGRHVYLLGQVKTPGSLPIPVDEVLTLVQAISQAGGFTDFAARDRVTILRSNKGAQERFVVNVGAMLTRGDLANDVVLQPEDVVSVPLAQF